MAEKNVLDRYIELGDRVVVGCAPLAAELDRIFAPDAVVDLGGGQVEGRSAIYAFYERFFAGFTEMRHLWQTSAVADNKLKAIWASVARSVDGQIIVASGVEIAVLNDEGLIASLHDTLT